MFVKIERLLQILSRRIPFVRAISNENSEIHDGSKYRGTILPRGDFQEADCKANEKSSTVPCDRTI
jgi:hypothetical protein